MLKARAYLPSKENEVHPELSFDFLGEMIEAAHEIGVKTPVYLSAGFDEKLARKHPEWLRRHKPFDSSQGDEFKNPGYCENGISTLIEEELDPKDRNDVAYIGRKVYEKYTSREDPYFNRTANTFCLEYI